MAFATQLSGIPAATLPVAAVQRSQFSREGIRGRGLSLYFPNSGLPESQGVVAGDITLTTTASKEKGSRQRM